MNTTDSIADEILQKGIPDSRDADVLARNAALEKSMETLSRLAPPPPPSTRELGDLAVDAINVVGMGLIPDGHKPPHAQNPLPKNQDLLPRNVPDAATEGRVTAGEAVVDAVASSVEAVESLATANALEGTVAAGEAVVDAVVHGIEAVESLISKARL